MTFKFGKSEAVLTVLQTDVRTVYCVNLVIADYWLRVKLSIKNCEKTRASRLKESKPKLKYNYDYCA